MTGNQETIIQRIKDGTASGEDQAELYESVKPFIRRIAEKYRPGLRCQDEVDDLLQEAFFALQAAASSWDPEAGGSFLTWLAFALHRAFQTYVSKSHGFSTGTNDKMRKAAHVEAEFGANHGASPPSWYVARKFGVKEETLEIWRQLRSTASLDAEIADDGLTILDGIADPVSMEDQVIDKLVNDEVSRLLHKYIDELDHDDRLAIELYFFHGLSHQKAAERLGLKRTTFQARLNKAVKKIGKVKHKNELGQLLPERIGSKPYHNPQHNGAWRSSTERAAILTYEHFYEKRRKDENDENNT